METLSKVVVSCDSQARSWVCAFGAGYPRASSRGYMCFSSYYEIDSKVAKASSYSLKSTLMRIAYGNAARTPQQVALQCPAAFRVS